MKTSSVLANLSTAALILTSLAACDSINGTLDVSQSITLVNPATPDMIEFCKKHPTDYYCKDVDTVNPTTTIQAGRYDAKLEFPTQSEVVLRTSVIAMKFQLPQGSSMPSYSGDFNVKSAQYPFSASGNLNTRESDSPSTSGQESCSITWYEHHCEYVPGPHGHGHQHCWEQAMSRPGIQNVTYHFHTTVRTIGFDLIDSTSAQTVGHFNGTSSGTNKVYTFTGICY